MSDVSVEHDVRERVEGLRARIRAAAGRAGRDPREVTLLGVCKRQPAERVAAAARAGVLHFAENYVQEAVLRRVELEPLLGAISNAEAIRWHFVGGLQRNKARVVAPLFDWIESVDSERLAIELDRRAQNAGRNLSLCIQVNLEAEAQKGGVPVDELPALLRACHSLAGLTVRGLMAIPAATEDPEQTRPAFARLRELRNELQSCEGGSELRELSMGMSGDFETAIEEGATIVRIGTALFGARSASA